MPAGELSRLLLDLHTTASAGPFDHCKERLLVALRRRIAFDSAIWGSGAENPQMIFGIATVDFPPEKLAGYAAWQSQDALRAAVAQRPGVCLRNEDLGPLSEHHASAIYQGFCHPAGLEHTLGIAEIDSGTNVGELIFLFRHAPDNAFTDQERDLLEQCMPHLVAGWRHRLLSEFANRPEGPAPLAPIQPGLAVVDALGHVHASDAGFGLAMRKAFPQWMGPRLPETFVRMIVSGGTAIKTTGQVFQLVRGTRRHILRLPDPRLAALSPAELRVAALFAIGLTVPAASKRLNLSQRTVRNHLTAIYKKLEVRSKVELARRMARYEG